MVQAVSGDKPTTIDRPVLGIGCLLRQVPRALSLPGEAPRGGTGDLGIAAQIPDRRLGSSGDVGLGYHGYAEVH